MKDKLEAMLAAGQDNPMLRFSLGNACLNEGDYRAAAAHLQAAVEQDAGYSAAWKLLGRALREDGQIEAAQRAWKEGLDVARGRGDMQVARELEVFLKRLAREAGP
jgi:predicted Zn-dependent protease